MEMITDLVVNEECIYDEGILKGDSQVKILAEGNYGYDSDKRHFVIVRTGLGHPCAYIQTKPDDVALKENPDAYSCIYDCFDVSVHGGPTYYGRAYWNKSDESMYLGWDYAHCYDYAPYDCFSKGGRQWTMLEIFADVIKAYSGIQEQNKRYLEKDGMLSE